MTAHRAFLYDGRSSGRQAGFVKLSVPGYIVFEEFSTVSRFALDAVVISPQLGSQPAIIDLPDGGRVEIADAAAFYAELQNNVGRRQWVHTLESRWSLVAAALIATVALGWFGYAWGIPAIARFAANAIPVELDREIGGEGLILLDRNVFAATELEPQAQEELRAAFADVTASAGADFTYRLEFRKGMDVGPNAFALPSGIVVITDELVGLAEQTDELAAVLAHEVGHVRNRHALRSLLQNSVFGGLLIMLTGDISSAGSIAAGLPALLAYASYSREFEYEADVVAKQYLDLRGIPRRRFTDLMLRLEQRERQMPAGMGLLRTHPATDERLAAFLE